MRTKEDFITKVDEIVNDSSYKPLYPKGMEELLKISDEEREIYLEALNEMEECGTIFFTDKGKLINPRKIGIKIGVFQKSARDFGFVILNDKNETDVFIHRSKKNGAISKDIVAVRITRKGRPGSRPEGQVVKIVRRSVRETVCTYFKHKNHGYAIPIERRGEEVFIRAENSMNAQDGDKVVVTRLDFSPNKEITLNGKIIEVMGHRGERGIDVLSLLRGQKFSPEFSESTLAETDKMPDVVRDKDIIGRRDMREEIIFTIDGDDTKDIDDAVSIKQLSDGKYRLGVYIADVSHYVRSGTKLDKSALERATSVYPIDRVSPMLPPKLSNGICSLNPGVDRLSLSVTMDIDKKGNIVDHDIFKSVIRSCHQMTYTNVYKIVEENDKELCDQYKDIVPSLMMMKELALILRKKRFERGAIDFNVPEAKIILDDMDIPVEIRRRELTIANFMIEEMMLACNETVAEHFYWQETPFVYRIHDKPDYEKMQSFCNFASIMGYKIKGVNDIHSAELQSLLVRVKGKPEERVISTILLRAMQKAKYTNEHGEHFGLGAKYYCHFTSPIRRYPDLMIHRIISESLAGKMTPERIIQYNGTLAMISSHCSERERASELVERESVKLKMAEYMQEHVGEEFSCIVSGVTNFGMFVETDDLIEGLVPMESLYDDYYIYDENQYALIGERTNKKYRIGDRVMAKVLSASTDTRTVEFELDLGKRRLVRSR